MYPESIRAPQNSSPTPTQTIYFCRHEIIVHHHYFGQSQSESSKVSDCRRAGLLLSGMLRGPNARKSERSKQGQSSLTHELGALGACALAPDTRTGGRAARGERPPYGPGACAGRVCAVRHLPRLCSNGSLPPCCLPEYSCLVVGLTSPTIQSCGKRRKGE